MKLFKLIEIDLEAERARIHKRFEGRMKRVLLELCELFERGEWQKCLDHVLNKDNFGYDERRECDEKEFIGLEVSRALEELGYANFWTQDQLLEEAKAKILGK